MVDNNTQRAVHHIGISVADLAEAVEFFRLVLQSEPLGTESHDRTPFLEDITGYADLQVDIAFFEVPGNHVVLEILQYLRPSGEELSGDNFHPGNMHLCLSVADIESEFVRLTAAGVVARSTDPVTVSEGPYRGTKFVYLRGPSGITLELTQSRV